MADREFLIKLERRLVDDGKLIEAGWVGLRLAAIPPGASALQLEEMRGAFFAGAHHLFASIMGIMEPGTEPTDNDLKRMSLISDELDLFVETFKKKHGIDIGTEH